MISFRLYGNTCGKGARFHICEAVRKMKDVRRGYCDEDAVLFGRKAMVELCECARDITYLLNRGYPFKNAVTFTGNHYQLAKRQRDALMRACASDEMVRIRKEKQLACLHEGCTVHVDGFNAVVLMETVLSGSMVLCGRDGCYRDLSGLAGTYAVIRKTAPAAEAIMRCLQEHGVSKAVFWLDAPVSNSGRLKTLLAETAEKLRFAADIQMVKDADFELKKRENVISGDSAVITECISWYNLYEDLIGNRENTWITEFQL